MSTVATDGESPGEYTLREGWRTLAIAGGVVALIGAMAIAFPLVSGLSLTLALGGLLVLGGVVHGVHAFSARGWRGSLWQLALAVVSIVAGLLLLANPIVGLASLTILLVAYLFVDGVTEAWAAVRMDEESGRAWIGASGVLSLVLAVALWIGFPATAAWAVGLLVGASLIATGLSMVFVAVAGRDLDDAAAPGTDPRGT